MADKSTDSVPDWKGIPRDQIDWHPTVDTDVCVGCGMCITSCGKKVFDYDENQDKSVVARPGQCMVGCTSCEVWCIYDAISFPDKEYVRDLIREHDLANQAHTEVKQKTQKSSA